MLLTVFIASIETKNFLPDTLQSLLAPDIHCIDEFTLYSLLFDINSFSYRIVCFTE